MSSELNKTYLELKSQCAELDKAGYEIRDKGAIEEYFKISLMKMLICISTQDDRMTKAETDFIGNTLGVNFSCGSGELENIKKKITPDSVTDSLQRICKVFIDAASDGKKTDYKKLGSFINDLGIGFVAADNSVDERETKFLGRLNYRLRVFGESYLKGIQNCGSSEQKPAPAKKSAPAKTPANAPAAKAQEKKKDEEELTLEQLMEKLDALVGLMSVKQEVYSLANLIKVRKLREERGFKQPDMSLHLVFTGNPGTGKTTVARLLAKIYHRLGVVREDVFVEVDRSGLVSNFIGHTAIKTREVCESALGGVLFIDEAYALTTKTGQNDYGIEAVNTLLKFMEDNRDDIVVICAGYTDLMEEFLNSNPGLRSRFNRFIEFSDYSASELRQMFELYLKQYSLKAGEGVCEYTEKFFEDRIAHKPEYFANGRDARNFFEKALSNQADRLADIIDLSDEQLMTLTLDDVEGVEL